MRGGAEPTTTKAMWREAPTLSNLVWRVAALLGESVTAKLRWAGHGAAVPTRVATTTSCFVSR